MQGIGRGLAFFCTRSLSEPPAGLLSLLELALVGCLPVFACRQHAFLSLPEATWQIDDQVIPAEPRSLSALFQSVWSKNLTHELLELFSIKLIEDGPSASSVSSF